MTWSHLIVKWFSAFSSPLMCLFTTNIISLSVPCVPLNVKGVMKCSTNTLQASWDAAAGAESYISTLWRSGGFSSSCLTADQRCLFTDLQCAQTYMFSVVATNNRCNSSESAMISARTGKCLKMLCFCHNFYFGYMLSLKNMNFNA